MIDRFHAGQSSSSSSSFSLSSPFAAAALTVLSMSGSAGASSSNAQDYNPSFSTTSAPAESSSAVQRRTLDGACSSSVTFTAFNFSTQPKICLHTPGMFPDVSAAFAIFRSLASTFNRSSIALICLSRMSLERKRLVPSSSRSDSCSCSESCATFLTAAALVTFTLPFSRSGEGGTELPSLFTTGEEASAHASHRVQAAHIRHTKAAGQPWSEEREAQWQQYAKNAPEPGPHSRWTITAATSALPCPYSIRPFSEAQQNWMMSRKEGIDLVLAAGAHDADRQDPDKAQEDFDLDDYIKKRRMARAAVAIERKTVLSAVPYDNALKQLAAHDFADPIFSASCSRCGEGFLANKSTQHRCGPEDSATPIAQHQSVTRRMILTTTELMDLFGEPSLDEDWAEPYRLLSISDVLETSALWSAFADYAFKRWPGPLVALHETVSSDSAPFLFAPKEQSTPAALEYEALLWAVTTLLEDVHGHEALESPRRLQPQKRTTLVAAMQHDHVDAVIRVRCGENELCDYDDFVSRVNSKGGPRQLQHRHTPPVEASAKGKDPVRQLQPKVERCIKTLFDLPVWMVRDLLLQEPVSRPAPQGQSILFYGISSERLAFIGARPLQQAGTTTSTVSQPRKRRSTTYIVDSAANSAFSRCLRSFFRCLAPGFFFLDLFRRVACDGPLSCPYVGSPAAFRLSSAIFLRRMALKWLRVFFMLWRR
ncbi:hypothetical protein A4X13_0g8230 [Tilletia indica]|uniref:Uncharacterized protein n=1 Tax=Tilletia indica TaxID=43049 RepID=A0A8T8SGX3_9BASI|nr:hypothetical protein A4X13_0g8230 [Tilletia indica]